MHPSSLRAFQRQQEHDLKHPSLVDLITTKQNKLPSFIDRFMLGVLVNGPTWQIRKKKPCPWLVAGFFLWINQSYFVNIFFSKKLLYIQVFFWFSSHQILFYFLGGANHQISLLGSSKMWRAPKHFSFYIQFIVKFGWTLLWMITTSATSQKWKRKRKRNTYDQSIIFPP